MSLWRSLGVHDDGNQTTFVGGFVGVINQGCATLCSPRMHPRSNTFPSSDTESVYTKLRARPVSGGGRPVLQASSSPSFSLETVNCSSCTTHFDVTYTRFLTPPPDDQLRLSVFSSIDRHSEDTYFYCCCCILRFNIN